MDKEMPVSVWPEWRIIEKIGEGSFGRVYKAQRCEQGKTFYSAIKIITIPASQSELNSVRSETADESSAREYFHGLMEECIQEVSTMEHFRGNSHVVSVEDFKVVEYLDEIGWDIYIRMEYLTSFMDYCTEKSLSEMEVIQLGVDLCKALQHCRQLNIIHRDIKPENIFVSRFGEFKIGDFGIARELERTMSGLSKKGTYSYMAPEMYRGEQYDNRVDIYSLGIVLYKLMNHNRLPFVNLEKQLITYRDKENALARRMSGEALSKPADAGEGFSLIILKACAYRPEERYQDAGEFRQDLEDLQRGILPQGVIDDLMSAGREKASPSEPPIQDIRRKSPENWAAKAWGLGAYASGKMQERGGENVSSEQPRSGQIPEPMSRSSQAQKSQMPKGQTQTGQMPKGQAQTGQLPKGQTQTGQMPKGQTQAGQLPKGQTQTGQLPKGQTQTGQLPKGHTETGQVPKSQPNTGQVYKEQIQKGQPQKEALQNNGSGISQRISIPPRGASSSRRRKKKKTISPWTIAVIVVAIAACIITGVYIKLLLDEDTGAEQQDPAQIWGEQGYYSEDGTATDEFSQRLQEIKDHATTIVNHLNEYSWQGMEGDIIYYSDPQNNHLMKALIYPAQSEDNVFEEYYYWDEELFYAYIWESNKEPNLYYYDEGKLIRWIDEKKVCHDNETDNSEFVKRGEKYLKNAETQLLLSKTGQETAAITDDSTENYSQLNAGTNLNLKTETEEVEYVLSD